MWQAAWPWLSVILLVALVVAPLVLFGWMVLATDLFRVAAVTVLDGRESTVAAVEKIINDELLATPLSQTIFLVQTEIMEARILNSLPQVRVVHIERKLPATLRVILQEKNPALLLLSNGQYYFVDEAGVPYEEAQLHTLPGVALPIVKNADKEARVALGVPAVAPGFVAFVQYVGDHLQEAVAAMVAEIRIPSLAAREVHVILDTNWMVKFDVTRDPERQLAILGRIVQVIQDEDKQELEYIDLRIPNRVYYK